MSPMQQILSVFHSIVCSVSSPFSDGLIYIDFPLYILMVLIIFFTLAFKYILHHYLFHILLPSFHSEIFLLKACSGL
jgi:hypothetical protein